MNRAGMGGTAGYNDIGGKVSHNNGNVLDIEGLSFSVNETPILKDIAFKAGKAEFIGLIGPNGAGKTTLLKCINGINRGKGTIKINGRSLDNMDNKMTARQVALMHQNTVIAYPFPAIDIVLTGRYPHLGRMQKESRTDYELAEKYMEYTDTIRFENRPVTQLSGGERQRVLFAKVLAQETGLILLDEPTANLDIAYEEQIFKYCTELCSQGRTIIAAVHDLKTASRYCTRLILMKEGRINADGPPEDVLTSSNLSRIYGVNALVYKNRITGLLDFYIHGVTDRPADSMPAPKIHVIGGGGSASAVIRLLFEKGCKITAGVFAHGDSDLSCAEIFGLDCLSGLPFSEISDELHQANIEFVRDADIVILCDMPFGYQNLKNLEAAIYAKKLVLIEEDDPAGRDFTGGKALDIYYELRKNALVTTLARLHEVL